MTLTEERTAKNKRGAETREKLIDATVQLVAEWGPDAVNLRDIGREADQKNNSVVQFHFGTKEGVRNHGNPALLCECLSSSE